MIGSYISIFINFENLEWFVFSLSATLTVYIKQYLATLWDDLTQTPSPILRAPILEEIYVLQDQYIPRHLPLSFKL